MKKTILISLLMLCALLAAAQPTGQHHDRYRERGLGSTERSSMERMLDSKVDAGPTVPHGYKDYSGEGLDALDRQMAEREWGSEDTAWTRACKLNTRQSYEKYTVMYPGGAHIAEANCRLIDAKVGEMLRDAHNSLPNIKHVEEDDDSPTSVIVIKNNTGLPLTVYCSGIESKRTLIPPDGVETVTLENGPYKLAATVPPPNIRPYAGKTSFEGGCYEMGFWIVESSY